MVSCILFALMLPPLPSAAPVREVAPAPREKACDKRGSEVCLCPDGNLRCRAKAALALKAQPVNVPKPSAVPSDAENAAARKALGMK